MKLKEAKTVFVQYAVHEITLMSTGK